MKLTLLLIASIGLWSCSRPVDTSETSQDTLAIADSVAEPPFDYESLFKLDSYLAEDIGGAKIETVDYDCAILVYPTDEQVEELKKIEGEDNFYVIADDAEFYQGMAVGLIDSLGVKTITASGQFLKLKGSEKTWDLDIRKKGLPEWNIIFFKTTKEPKIVPAIDLTAEGVTEYFR